MWVCGEEQIRFSDERGVGGFRGVPFTLVYSADAGRGRVVVHEGEELTSLWSAPGFSLGQSSLRARRACRYEL
ncbi:MAG: hypothetical protein OXC27_12920 [Caldilineaceae bacterium]|nr:hypothetical protein [Caldilineaceae bacterium]